MSSPRDVASKVYRRYRPRHDPTQDPVTRLPQSAEAYRDLDSAALLFDRIELRNQPGGVALLIPTVKTGLSAGPMTGLRFGLALAAELGMPARVITTNRWDTGETVEAEGALRIRLGAPSLRIDHVGTGRSTTASPDDVWVGTAFGTAFALLVAARSQVIDPQRVVYLIQDYEPGFSQWSSTWAVAQATYHAGFQHVVNSTPLATYLCEQKGPIIAEEHIMAPDLDLARLSEVAQRRRPGPLDVFFYARPPAIAPRNMYALGLASARRAATLTHRDWRLVLAGQPMEAPVVAGVEVECLGQTTTDGYYDLMARTPVALSLMMSPHPSHPPLDWAISGGSTVTNRFGNSREGLHPRLLAADADPDALGSLLAHPIDNAEIGDYVAPEPMGRPMADVVRSLAGISALA